MTAVATLSLALGIGINASMFSVVNASLLRPLPYESPSELVAIWGRYLPSSGYDFPYFALSDPEALDLMRETKALSGVAPYRWRRISLGGRGSEPEQAWALEVPANWSSLLGVEPAMGRTFDEAEARAPGSCVTLLGHETWEERLGSDAAVVGGAVEVDGAGCTVVGVMPEGFFFLDRRVRLFLPLVLDARPEARGNHGLGAVGRLAPGVSLEEARTEMTLLMDRWAIEIPDHHAKGHVLFLESLSVDQVRDVRPALLVLMGAVGLMLLIVCSNVANLLLVRAESRRRELALRASLGAGRARLVRQLLTESALLALLGGGFGVLVSAWTLEGALSFYPEPLPGASQASLDGDVLLFALALTLGTVFLFGLAPALSASARGPVEALHAGGRATGGKGRVSVQRVLVVAEVGLSLTLLVGAGLLLRSFTNLRRVDLGFEPDRVVTLSMSASPGAYPNAGAVRRLQTDLLSRVSSIPSVESAALISALPLENGAPADNFHIENRPDPEPGETAYNADYVMVSPRLFETLRIPLVRGRALSAGDDAGAPLVAVLNETAARNYFGSEDPIGRRIRYYGDDLPWITIVGIVGDVRSTRLQLEPRPAVYVPIVQSPRGPGYDLSGNVRSFALAVRTRQRPADLFPSLRAAVREVAPSLPIASAMTMTEVVSRAAAAPRFTSLLMGVFAGTALLLAIVGIYGVMSFSVEQARQAIGIRRALGATTKDVLRLVVEQGAALGIAGVGFGLVASFALSRTLEGLLFRVGTFDALTFVSLSAILAAVVLLAAAVPAWRAARLDVIETLRHS
jgi:putative ABC transport system permease protein